MNMQLLVAMQLAGGGGASFIFMMVLMIAIFYFLLIRPQQSRQKKWQAMLESIKAGDKVVTTGGLRGTVIALKDDCIHLRVPPDNLRLEVTKASVAPMTKRARRQSSASEAKALTVRNGLIAALKRCATQSRVGY
jgi:preprotein translocase subunit YajC